MITMSEARRAFSMANEAGRGFAPRAATVDGAREEVVQAGAEIVLDRAHDDDVLVVRETNGALIGIGDVNGAWACDLGPYL